MTTLLLSSLRRAQPREASLSGFWRQRLPAAPLRSAHVGLFHSGDALLSNFTVIPAIGLSSSLFLAIPRVLPILQAVVRSVLAACHWLQVLRVVIVSRFVLVMHDLLLVKQQSFVASYDAVLFVARIRCDCYNNVAVLTLCAAALPRWIIRSGPSDGTNPVALLKSTTWIDLFSAAACACHTSNYNLGPYAEGR